MLTVVLPRTFSLRLQEGGEKCYGAFLWAHLCFLHGVGESGCQVVLGKVGNSAAGMM